MKPPLTTPTNGSLKGKLLAMMKKMESPQSAALMPMACMAISAMPEAAVVEMVAELKKMLADLEG